MAPCSARTLDHQAGGQLRKLRKPVIEKMRRDRINSSIEQLHILLEKEFQRHQLPSKPEKADILEMAVTLLQRHMAERSKCPVPALHTPHMFLTESRLQQVMDAVTDMYVSPVLDVTASSQAQREGFSTCVQDSITFLPVQNQQDNKNIRYFNGHNVSYELSTMMTSNEPSLFTGNRSKSIWRPW
ncbi:transcription factor HES-5-like isoform X1 [Bufo bufo]|uniref:transcription factor HES-5-like isoform X1 n=1 Tax=Bufo bufo TaxID=8384 RepID=UPI001ABE2D7B|nr:transcription factor HES-5-like isoform X1 [Bufo bufo]